MFMRMGRNYVRALAAAAIAVLTVSGCSKGLGGGDTAGSTDVIKIGYVSPQTGPLAPFGEADSFVVKQMTQLFKDKPLKVGAKTYQVEIIVKDSQSDSKRAGEVAAELINTDGVDLMLVASTPDTTNPVADQCEANGVPCISTVAPWQPFFFGRGGSPTKSFNWTYHFFWGLEDVEAVYQDMWSQVTTNKTGRRALAQRPGRHGVGRQDERLRPGRRQERLLHCGPRLLPERHRGLHRADLPVQVRQRRHPSGRADSAGLHQLLEAGQAAGLHPEDRHDRQGTAVPVVRGGTG